MKSIRYSGCLQRELRLKLQRLQEYDFYSSIMTTLSQLILKRCPVEQGILNVRSAMQC